MQVFKAPKQSSSLDFLGERYTNGSLDCLQPTDGPKSSFICFSVKVHHNDLRAKLIVHPKVLEDARVIGEEHSWLSDVFNLTPLTCLVTFLLLDKVVLVIIFVECCCAPVQ